MEWIMVYYAENEIDAHTIKGLLESNDVQVKMVPNRSGSILKAPELFTYANLPYEIFVQKDQRDQAQKILNSVTL